jgi:hypothetical protein
MAVLRRVCSGARLDGLPMFYAQPGGRVALMLPTRLADRLCDALALGLATIQREMPLSRARHTV